MWHQGRWSETHPGTPFRGVVAPPLQPLVEAVRTASGLTKAEWALLLLRDLVDILEEPRASSSRAQEGEHRARTEQDCNASGYTSSVAGRWCPNPDWCRRAARTVDFSYVQSLFSIANTPNGLRNMDENIKVSKIGHSSFCLCIVLS